MISELRSDHAGETGAVHIYRGINAVARCPRVRDFARRHQIAEERHLEIMNGIVPGEYRSKLLWLWSIAGWVSGALPALVGASAVYRTIDAVETFVDHHYSAQIDQLALRPEDRALREILESCRADELEHRDEARSQLLTAGLIGRLWVSMVGAGSRAGVFLARRF